MQNKRIGKCRVKQGLHTTGREVIRDGGTGAKARINTFNIGIHLRNPYGTATATCNPKAQDRLLIHGNDG